jgi:tetratricopeptide (TPR) repeat protein
VQNPPLAAFFAGFFRVETNLISGHRYLRTRNDDLSNRRTSMSRAPKDSGASPKPVKEPRAPGLLDDPVVRIMAYVSLGLVVLFLATAVGVVLTGVATPTGPRSSVERDLLLATAGLRGATGEAQAPYVEALIEAGNLPAARAALAQARASVPATAQPAADLDLAEARLSSKAKDYEKAVALADTAMAGYKTKYEAAVARSKNSTQTTTPSVRPNYYTAALVKAYALVQLGRFKDAIPAFDIYIKVNPTASDIFIDRGNAKLKVGDKAGAEKDFREALKYVPYDAEAKAGLKQIGVAQ